MPVRPVQCVVLLAVCPLLAAQPPATPGLQQPLLQPIEQGVEDENALRNSLREQAVDMRAPSNWDRVYRVNQNLELYPGAKQAGAHMARASGALIAVFRESTYVPVAPGVAAATLPPGLVWVLGDPNSLTRPPVAPQRSSYSPPSLLHNQTSVHPPDSPITKVISQSFSNARTIWTNDSFRQERIAALLESVATD